MTKKRVLLSIVVVVLVVFLAMALWVAFSGEFVFWSREPSIRALKAYVRALPDVSLIEVIYRPGREWIDEPGSSPE